MLKISDFKHSTINFQVSKIISSSTVWINSTYQGFQKTKLSEDDIYRSFSQKFSYAIPTSNGSDLEYDQSDQKVMLGERYGGIGINKNGGGVRCGNLGEYQVKGIGVNKLVGKGVDISHSYGGLDLKGAILETVFTNTINKVLPIGAVNVVGLIYTGSQSGMINDKRVPGALLVRDVPLRPAHFLPCPNFVPLESNRTSLCSDRLRTMKANQELNSHFNNTTDYIKYLGKFLSNCAKQFAFAKVHGVGHRTVSPSNIAFDGAWLDVPLASFVGGGINFIASRPLYDEPFIAIEIVRELTYTYSKYNETLLNAYPLYDYYLSQLDAYFSYYFSTLLSLPDVPLSYDKDASWALLVKLYGSILENSTQLVEEGGNTSNMSPALRYVIFLYQLQLNRQILTPRLFDDLSLDILEIEKLASAFNETLLAVFRSRDISSSFDEFVMSCAIKAIKRNSQISFFHASNGIEQKAESLCEDVNILEIKSFIEECQNIGDWIFEDEGSEETTLFCNEHIQICFLSKTNVFQINQYGTSYIYSSFEMFIEHVMQIDETELTINNYCFKPSIMNLKYLLRGNDHHV